MAANEVVLKIKVDDDGTLRAVGNEAEGAAAGVEKVGKSTEKTTAKKKQYNKVEKGVGQLTANTTKAFSKQNGVITSGIVPAYAILASNVFALTAAFNFLKRAFDVQALQDSQMAFAESTGTALGGVTQRLREASDGMLGFREAAEASAIGLAKGFSPTQLEELAEGARKASTALGRDFQDAFDRLLRGASKAEPELLDELGITLRLEEATQRYADAIGKNRKELNEYERSQAVLIETQRQLNKNFGDVEAISNPFIVLSKTFEDLIKTVTGSVLPIFTAFADIINRNAMAAVAVFGALGVSILKTIIPADKISATFENFFSKQDQNVLDAIADQEAYKASIEATDQAIRDSRKDAAKTASRGILQEGGPDAQKSAILQKLKKGVELSPQELGTLKKSLKKAEAEYKKTGRITQGMFKGVSMALVRDLSGGIKKTEVATVSLSRRMTRFFKKQILNAKVLETRLRVKVANAFKFIGQKAAAAGRLMNKALSLAGFIGIITMVIEMFNKLRENLADIIKFIVTQLDKGLNAILPFIDEINIGVLSLVDSGINNFRAFSNGTKEIFTSVARAVLGSIDSLINGFLGGIDTVIENLNKVLPEASKISRLSFTSDLASAIGDPELNTNTSNLAGSYERLAGSVKNLIKEFVDDAGITAWAEGVQSTAQASRASKEALDSFRDSIGETSDNLPGIIKGIKDSTDAVKQGKQVANAIQSLDLVGSINKLNAQRVVGIDPQTREAILGDVLLTQDREKALQELRDSFQGLGSISRELETEFSKSLDLGKPTKRLQQLQNAANNAKSAMTAFEAAVGPTGTAVQQALAGGDVNTALQRLTEVKKQVDIVRENFDELGQSATANDAMATYEGIAASLKMNSTELDVLLTKITATTRAIEQDQAMLQFSSGIQKEVLEARIKSRDTLNKLEIANLAVTASQTDQERIANQQKADLLAIEARRLEISRNFAAFEEIAGKIGSQNSEQAFQAITLETAAMEKRLVNLKATIQAQGEKDGADQTEIDAMIKKAELIERLTTFGRNASTALEGVAKDFAKIGPEGKMMSEFIGGATTMTTVFTESFAIIADAGTSGFDKIKAAGTALMAGIQGIAQMQKASSEMRVKEIDNEIAAEKKRDGSSAASLARIAQLEKKKDAEKRKAFEAEKKMKMAQTVMATAQGAMSAFASAMVLGPIAGPIVGGILAAMIVAMGAKQLAMIASSTYSGGGSAGSASGPTSISAGNRRDTIDIAKSQGGRGELAYMRGERGTGGPENFTPAFSGYRMRAEGGNTALMVGEQGPELFVPNRPGRVIPNDDITAAGPTNVSFNINTIDASGVEDMLTVQRGNIIGMIREAANSYGEDFVESVDTSILTPTADRGASRY